MKAGTRADVVNNQLAVVTGKDSKTSVQGLNTLERAESIALAGESVPAGRYTRQALITLGILREAEKEAAEITTQEVSKALNNVEISEQDNVSKVLFAVAEGSCEVGTVYYSDIYGYENRLDIIEAVSHDLTGDVRYAAGRVMRMSKKKQAFVDGILTLPMVLPPTVAGFFLLLVFSRRRALGIFLFDELHIKVVQTWLGCIIAATIIAFPLMYRNARAAFEQVDMNLIHAGRTLGMPEYIIFWKIVMPEARPGPYPKRLRW